MEIEITSQAPGPLPARSRPAPGAGFYYRQRWRRREIGASFNYLLINFRPAPRCNPKLLPDFFR